MDRDRPGMRLPTGKGLGKLPGLRVCLLLLLGTTIMCATAQAKDPGPEDFVGNDVCASCHKEAVTSFADNPHAKAIPTHGRNGVSCEDCHGAGKAHAESSGKAEIFNPANGTTKEVDVTCLACHLARHVILHDSDHANGNVSCLACHDIHHSKAEALLKARQPTLCYKCHADIEPQFSMAFHHKVNEGLVQCSDCHDPHGAYKKKGHNSAIEQNSFCIKCHSKTAGPFLYEHAVVKSEGCTACHFPHGGANPNLLNRTNVDTICRQCHFPSPGLTTSTPAVPFHDQAAQSQSCIDCHVSIHGSNISPVFSKHGD